MLCVRSVFIAFFAILAAFAVGVQSRSVNYDLESIPIGEYRLMPFGEFGMPQQKRVPSAGDMMVRFGKRAA